MISCGEPSGDLYAGALATEILRLDPSATIVGLGGRHLREAGASLTADFGGLSVTGLLEVFRVLPRTYETYRRLVRQAKTNRPDVLVVIDFPDFNFRLARAVRRLDIPVVYYISPQLWAWRRGRMKTMRQIADRVLVIFPFEEPIYRQAGIPAQWVGHPLLDIARPAASRETFFAELGLDPLRPLVALLPGSRHNELQAILPDLVRAGALIRQRIPAAQFVVARAPHLADESFAPLDQLSGVVTIEGRSDDVLAVADVALVASGTVTVQAALHECPMVVVYRLSPLTYRLGKPFVHVDTYAMANLVAGRRVVPELIQDEFTPDGVAAEALRVLTDPDHAASVRRDLHEVRGRLGAPGASRRAAEAVLDVANMRTANREPRGASREARDTME
jgi:lipid-A-disaccharide synthase